jgi:hypothetical protein
VDYNGNQTNITQHTMCDFMEELLVVETGALCLALAFVCKRFCRCLKGRAHLSSTRFHGRIADTNTICHLLCIRILGHFDDRHLSIHGVLRHHDKHHRKHKVRLLVKASCSLAILNQPVYLLNTLCYYTLQPLHHLA